MRRVRSSRAPRRRHANGVAAAFGAFGAALIAVAFASPELLPDHTVGGSIRPGGADSARSARGVAPADWGQAAPATAPTGSAIDVPALGLHVPLVETTDQDGYLVLPDAPWVAHYVRAAPLGAARGSTVLAGHVNFADGALAPLAGLARLGMGAPIYLTDSAGGSYRYRVVGLETFPKGGLAPSTFDTEGPARLVLITCDQNSPWVSVGGVAQFADNTVATAVPWP